MLKKNHIIKSFFKNKKIKNFFIKKIDRFILNILFFLIFFFLNYIHVTRIFHGSRKIHIYVIILSIICSLLSILLINKFFIKSAFNLKKEIIFRKIKIFVEKNLLDILNGFFLFFLSFLFAYFYISIVENRNLSNIFYAATSEFPRILIPIKKQFSSILYSLTIFISYFLFRLFRVNKYISFILCIVFLTSQFHIYNLIPAAFRDYFKAPIIIYVIYSSIFVILSKTNHKIIILLTTIIIGFGLYIRQDLLFFFVIFLFSIFLNFAYNNSLSKKNFLFIISLILFIFVPLLLLLNYGTLNTFIFSGFVTPSEENFYLLKRPLYDFGYYFNDNYLIMLGYLDPNFIFKIILNFPADLIMKMFSSLFQILNLPSDNLLPPLGIENQYIKNFYEYRYYVLGFFKNNIIISFFFLSLIILIYNNLSKGLFVSIIILIICFYPIAQFQARHYFHLELIPLLCVGFILQNIINFYCNYKKILKIKFFNKIRSKKILIIFCIFVLSYFFIQTLKIYQKFNYDKILAKINNLKKVELILSNDYYKNKIIFRNKNLFNDNDSYPKKFNRFQLYANIEYLMIQFDFNVCGLNTFSPILKYHSKTMDDDLTRLIRIDKENVISTNNAIIIPVYDFYRLDKQNKKIEISKFVGIELNMNEQKCLKTIYKLVDFPNNIPLSMSIFGNSQKPYFEFSSNNNTYENPINIERKLNQNLINFNFEKIDNSIINYNHLNITKLPTEVILNNKNYCKISYCRSSFNCNINRRLSFATRKDFSFIKTVCDNDSDLLWSKNIKKNKGDILFIEGIIINGGLRAGIVGQNGNIISTELRNRGNFKIFMEVPVNDDYNFGISNYFNIYSNVENHIIIKNIGWFNKVLINY